MVVPHGLNPHPLLEAEADDQVPPQVVSLPRLLLLLPMQRLVDCPLPHILPPPGPSYQRTAACRSHGVHGPHMQSFSDGHAGEAASTVQAAELRAYAADGRARPRLADRCDLPANALPHSPRQYAPYRTCSTTRDGAPCLSICRLPISAAGVIAPSAGNHDRRAEGQRRSAEKPICCCPPQAIQPPSTQHGTEGILPPIVPSHALRYYCLQHMPHPAPVAIMVPITPG